MYPSDAITPRQEWVIKVHKQEKNYPMRTIVSTVGTAPYGISKYLVDIIQPILNKKKHCIMNSSSLLNETVTWETNQAEIKVSFDVLSLYPSIAIDKAITVWMDLK